MFRLLAPGFGTRAPGPARAARCATGPATPQGAGAGAQAVLRLDGISLAFGGVAALRDVSVVVMPGEIRAIIGPNGAGKSSLLNVVTGLYRPQAGTVTLGGQVHAQVPTPRLASLGVGRTFQNLALFGGLSVLDNVAAGCSFLERAGLFEQLAGCGRAPAERRETLDRARQAIGFFDLEPHAGHLAATADGPIFQIIQAAVDTGIARGTLQETISFVREKSRAWVDSGQEHAWQDPYTIQRIGDLSVRLSATEALLEKAGRVIDRAVANPSAQAGVDAQIAVAEAKILSTEISIEATNRLFELAGTRSTLGEHNLDRHWRNARTHTLHDPVRWKYAIVGNYVLNGINPPLHAWS
jgi:ABC-type sugar transport system ATPase subunit